jgi:opacity protein-like surface antigen
MRRITVLAAAAALLGTVQTVSAQTPTFALEVRGGYAIPTGDWNEDDTFENGFGFGGNVIAQVTPQIGVYGGWESFTFNVDEDEEGVEADATDAGFRAGVIVNVPLAMAPNVAPFLEVGALYNTLEIGASGDGASVEIESEASVGFEGGVGVAVALGERLSVVPMVRYRQHNVEFEDLEGESEDISYVVVGVGLRLRL